MKKNIFPGVCFSIYLVFILLHSVYANDGPDIPDISGEWINLAENGEATEAIFVFSQDGNYLEGKFTDSREGKILIEAQTTGYIDKKGNVIFDIYFGRITSTNRLKLSSDKNALDGNYVNNAGKEGEVHLLRKLK